MRPRAVTRWTKRRANCAGASRGMHSIFYIIGVVVVVLAILSFLGFG